MNYNNPPAADLAPMFTSNGYEAITVDDLKHAHEVRYCPNKNRKPATPSPTRAHTIKTKEMK